MRLRTKVTEGHGSKAAALAMAFKLIESAQRRWRMVNAPHLVALLRAGAVFINGKLVERPEDQLPDGSGGSGWPVSVAYSKPESRQLWRRRRVPRCGVCAVVMAALGCTPRHVTGLSWDVLRDSGFVERWPHPSDRRAISVALTERGADTARWRESARAIPGDLPGTDLAVSARYRGRDGGRLRIVKETAIGVSRYGRPIRHLLQQARRG